jgi:hypothetical protein
MCLASDASVSTLYKARPGTSPHCLPPNQAFGERVESNDEAACEGV